MSYWVTNFPVPLNMTKWDELIVSYTYAHDEITVSWRKINRRLLLLLP